MNSDASDARKDRAGRGERRYLRLGRESSVQLPGEESWLDDLDGYEAEGVELDDEEVRRLVGTVLEDWEEDVLGSDVAVLDLESTPRAAAALGGERGYAQVEVPVEVDMDTTAGADQSASSVWDESDAFWASSTPPLEAEVFKSKKQRMFEVARDGDVRDESYALGGGKMAKGARGKRDSAGERKRSVLGEGTPNVQQGGARTQVTSPMMTPGSYYDEDGFLRA
ncbi:hypothetical protein N0V94_005356 [Neodidymelliopsis sp. IMI 364377]|nr:hypothetical protein N0V94_005356 [Neodidymelliopsis sp. IMI 364377]